MIVVPVGTSSPPPASFSGDGPVSFRSSSNAATDQELREFDGDGLARVDALGHHQTDVHEYGPHTPWRAGIAARGHHCRAGRGRANSTSRIGPASRPVCADPGVEGGLDPGNDY